MVIHADDRQAQGLFRAEDVVSEIKDGAHPKPYVEGKDIVRWAVNRMRFLEYGTQRAPAMFSRPTFPELHHAKEKLLALRMCGDKPAVHYDDLQLFSNHTVTVLVPWHLLKGVVNRSIDKSAKYRYQPIFRHLRLVVVAWQMTTVCRVEHPSEFRNTHYP
jgi:hypothetical protein